MKKGKKRSEPSVFLSNIPYHYHYLLVALFAGSVYWNTLNADFVYDDRPAILNNDDVLGRTTLRSLVAENDFWGNPISLEGSHKSYRPLITVSFRLQFAVHGLKADLFHGVNLIIHVINALLVLKLARQLKIVDDDLSLISALLFSCHPITSEAVCSIVGRADLLSTTFILLAITTQISSPNCYRTVLLAVLAVASKETGVILLPLIGIYKFLFQNANTKCFRRDIITYFLTLSIICYLRLFINNFQSPKFSKNDNPIAYDPNFSTRTLTFFYLPIFHLNLIVFPKALSFDWSMDAIPKVESILDSRIIMAIISYVVGLKIMKQLVTFNLETRNSSNSNLTEFHENRALLFLLALFTTPHILSSNIFAYVGFVAAERVLYQNTVSYCILLVFTVHKCRKRFSIPYSIWMSLFFIVIASFSYKTIQRVEDWKTEESLFKSALEVNPTKAHMNLGYVYTSQGKYDLAKHHYKQALKRKGNLADAWYNLGILTSKSSNSTHEAILYYHKALQSRSNFAAAHLNLALLLNDLNRDQQAFSHLDECLSVSGKNLKSYRNHQRIQATCAYNKGLLLQKNKKYHEAIENFKLALKLGGSHFEHTSSVLNSIGISFNEIGDESSAEKFYDMAMSENHVNSYLTMAHMKIRQNRSFEVENLFRKVMVLAPESVTVLQNIALAEFNMQNYNRSLLFYRKALLLDPFHLDSLRGIANLFQETQDYSESEHYYRKIVDCQPHSYSAHANYGAILHLNQKYEQALNEYNSALALNPADIVAKENQMKVLRILKRKNNF